MADPELGGAEEAVKRSQTPEDGLDPVIDSELNAVEKRFLLFAERGDVASVSEELDRTKDNQMLNINCADPLGRTALVIAIDNENQEMMELLLNNGAEPRDSLLHAISEDFVEGVEYLLSWEEANHKKGEPYSWERIDERVATFTPEITPLIMAAQRNNYEILKLLLDRGATLPLPHDVKCGCDECVLSQQRDGLRHSRGRITAYQALSCPSLICLSSRDPILSAFELSAELRKLSSIDTEFKTEYVNLRKNVQHFAESLVEQTRKSLELEIILNYDPDGGAYVPGERMHFERLKTAIMFRQKEFISHPNVQQLLGTVWYDGMPGFRRKPVLGQLTEILAIAASFPIYSSMYIMAPHSSWGHRCRKPFVKFIIHSSSYMFFLFLLVMVSQRVESMVVHMFGTESMVERQDEYERCARGAIPSYMEMMVIFYVMAFLWAEIKQLWENGLGDYLGDMWNIVDFCTNWFYVNWIALRATAFVIVWREQSEGIDPWRPKEQWHPYDPMFISEGMYGAANIFSFLKLIHIVSVNQHLGPLQISLGRMVFDILKFMCIVMLIVFSYACGLNQMLWYYADLDKNLCYSGPGGTPNPDEENSCQIWRRFSNLFETSQSLFWAVFGLVDIENFELTGIQEFTRFWTLLMFGSYSAINIVVLLNLLIAMMSSSYNIIFERSDMEWKFARSKLWMSYFEDGSTLPPPFNIIPTPKAVVRLFCSGRQRQAASSRYKDQQRRDRQYFSVMRALVRRYVTSEQKKMEDTGVTEDDINEVKQDINSFRYHLLDVLRKNGFTSGNTAQEQASGGRKQQQKERRLIKGFNIGLVENANFSLNSSTGNKTADFFSKVLLGKGKKMSSKKKDWNAVVRDSMRNRDHIGSSVVSLERSHRRSCRLSKRRQEAMRKGMAMTPVPRPKWKKVQYMTKHGAFKDGMLDQELVNQILSTDRRMSTGWGRVQALQLRGAFKDDEPLPIPEDDERRASVYPRPADSDISGKNTPCGVTTEAIVEEHAPSSRRSSARSRRFGSNTGNDAADGLEKASPPSRKASRQDSNTTSQKRKPSTTSATSSTKPSSGSGTCTARPTTPSPRGPISSPGKASVCGTGGGAPGERRASQASGTGGGAPGERRASQAGGTGGGAPGERKASQASGTGGGGAPGERKASLAPIPPPPKSSPRGSLCPPPATAIRRPSSAASRQPKTGWL